MIHSGHCSGHRAGTEQALTGHSVKLGSGQHSLKQLYLPNGILDRLWPRGLRCGIRTNGFWAAAGDLLNGRPRHLLLQHAFVEAVLRLIDLQSLPAHIAKTAKANTHTLRGKAKASTTRLEARGLSFGSGRSMTRTRCKRKPKSQLLTRGERA